ncbi:MAG: fumarylacetoacetate hydrolase family protein [Sporomusaceae bacterium]|nr:fumarylacetoacetate hydrolase family protein [Sporomusaceae bacterium]
MYFLTYRYGDVETIGLLSQDGKKIIPLLAAEERYCKTATLPHTLLGLIDQGEQALSTVKKIATAAEADLEASYLLPLAAVKILAPIPRPRKNIFCIGKNYAAHAKEFDPGADVPLYPVVFTKAPTTVIGPDEPIQSHKEMTQSLDYEVELAVVIGKTGKNITKETAWDYVFGYTIFNDVTARDLQKRHNQWFLGKNLDTSGPMGPYLVHQSAIADFKSLTIQSKVNGEVRQEASLSDLLFDIPTLLATISATMTLEAGDIIATGTPAGVGAGFTPPKFLQSGDTLELSITHLGVLKNTIA